MHLGENVWSSVVAQEVEGVMVYDHHSWTHKTLAPYARFKKLVGESKYASKYVSTIHAVEKYASANTA